MSTYLQMWKHINQLTPEEVKEWSERTSKCEGEVVDFKGVQIMDFELYEALSHIRDRSEKAAGV